MARGRGRPNPMTGFLICRMAGERAGREGERERGREGERERGRGQRRGHRCDARNRQFISRRRRSGRREGAHDFAAPALLPSQPWLGLSLFVLLSLFCGPLLMMSMQPAGQPAASPSRLSINLGPCVPRVRWVASFVQVGRERVRDAVRVRHTRLGPAADLGRSRGRLVKVFDEDSSRTKRRSEDSEDAGRRQREPSPSLREQKCAAVAAVGHHAVSRSVCACGSQFMAQSGESSRSSLPFHSVLLSFPPFSFYPPCQSSLTFLSGGSFHVCFWSPSLQARQESFENRKLPFLSPARSLAPTLPFHPHCRARAPK